MKLAVNMLLPGLFVLPMLLPLGGCGCGFDCNSEDNNDDSSSLLTLGFSDSLPEDLKQVVIEVDSITFQRAGVADVVVETFTIPDLNLVNVPTFKVDLLQYQGTDQLEVITDLKLATGTYDAVSIEIRTGDANQSYVEDENDNFKALLVSSGFRELPGMRLSAGKQAFTLEFGLAQALTQASSDTYLLTTRGVRMENNRTAATLSGTIDSTLFNSVSPCTGKGEPTEGNRVYIYKGGSLLSENLADVFNIDSTTAIPANAIAPFAVASITSSPAPVIWTYTFGFIPPGSYTIAFACNTAADDAEEYNGLVIPLPSNQKYEITLTDAQEGVCNLKQSARC